MRLGLKKAPVPTKQLTFGSRFVRVLTESGESSRNALFTELPTRKGGAMKKKQQPELTHEEVRRAIQKFMSNGGLIKHLPDQQAVRTTLVGSRWSMFEHVMESTETAPTES